MSATPPLSWDAVRIQQARTLAQRSKCTRAKVGAIITGPEGRHIVGEGYNGPPSGYQHGSMPCTTWCQRAGTTAENPLTELSPVYDDCPPLHAEANALMRSDHTARVNGSIYVTSHVCFGCAKLIANSGLSRVVVDTDKADAHRNPLASYQFLIQCGLRIQLSDLVMQSRLDGEITSARGWVTSPPFPGTSFTDLIVDNARRFSGAADAPGGAKAVVPVMTYDERVARERNERAGGSRG